MDHEPLLDLRHLDDPEPPRFAAAQAEEASHLAAVNQSRRARLLAGSVLAVAAVIGVGSVSLGDEKPVTDLAAAPPSTPAPPDDGGVGSTTLAPEQAGPTTAAPTTTSPAGPTATTGPGISAAATASPRTSAPRPTPVPTTRPIGPVTAGPPPEGTVPAPAGLRLTLSVAATEIRIGSSVRGVIRLENSRSTIVTLAQPGCGPVPSVSLYRAGRSSDARTCEGLPSIVVPPGTTRQDEVEVYAMPTLKAGTYDAFATTRLEEDGVYIHSQGVVVNVVRP